MSLSCLSSPATTIASANLISRILNNSPSSSCDVGTLTACQLVREKKKIQDEETGLARSGSDASFLPGVTTNLRAVELHQLSGAALPWRRLPGHIDDATGNWRRENLPAAPPDPRALRRHYSCEPAFSACSTAQLIKTGQSRHDGIMAGRRKNCELLIRSTLISAQSCGYRFSDSGKRLPTR